MDYKDLNAPKTTITRNLNELDERTGNIYETVTILSQRAEQINDTIREELHDKLEEFATNTESLEEIFENKEQIEVSKYYEALPKPVSIAVEEWLRDRIYYRKPEAEEKEA